MPETPPVEPHPVPRTAGRPSDPRLDQAILDALGEELLERGYARVTTASVARRAGVSTATLYRRWSSKRELLLHAAQQIVAEAIRPHETGSLRGELRDMLEQKRRVMAGPYGATLLTVLGESAHDPELADTLRAGIFDTTWRHIHAIVERAAARGELRTVVSPDTATRFVIGVSLADAALGTLSADTPSERSDSTLDEEVAVIVAALTGSPAASTTASAVTASPASA